MSHYTDEDVQVAALALAEEQQDALKSWHRDEARAVLDAVAPAIASRAATRAKAEALREAACNLPTLTIQGITVADVLNEWADEIERGES